MKANGSIHEDKGIGKEAKRGSTACRSERSNQPQAVTFPTHTALKTRLRDALRISKPDIGKAYLYDRCVNKYVDVMLPAIRAAISIKPSSDLPLNHFYFCQNELREAIGTIGKTQRYIDQVMKDDASTSLLLIERKGFNTNKSQPSIVRLNPIYEDLIVDAILNLHIEANQKLLEEIERTANYWVPVDKASLRGYIDKTAESLRATRNGNHYERALLRNLAAAQQLLAMTHNADEQHPVPYIKERWELADCGRIYGQGYSLQRMPKEVRHAALGVCHKYDFKASAFALMAGLAHKIDPALCVGGVLDYVKDRAKTRQRIAKQLNISESLVKTFFTAIGFGAELKNNQHNAIRGALAKAARQQQQLDSTARLDKDVYNNLGEDEYQRLIADPTFRYIYDEFQAINAAILAHYKDKTLVIGDNTYQPIDPKTGKKRTDRQKLAWIYQALESQAMFLFVELAANEAGQEPVLTTHDCLYFKQKLSAEQVKDIAYLLQQSFPYLRFEHEEIFPITGDAEYAARFADADEFEQQHKMRIAAETERAKHYTLRSEREPIYPMAGNEEYDADCADYLMDEVEQRAWLRQQESLAIYHRITNKIRKLLGSALGA